MKYIAVFGDSQTPEGSARYESARKTARLLAERGFGIVTGGYGGVMEAASRGAREGGGRTLGITTRAFDAFPERRPNAYLDEHVHEATLFSRTEALFNAAAGFVVYPGAAGTLAEAAFLWAMIRAGVMAPAGQPGGKPLVFMDKVWHDVLSEMTSAGFLSERETRACAIANTEEEIRDAVVRFLTP